MVANTAQLFLQIQLWLGDIVVGGFIVTIDIGWAVDININHLLLIASGAFPNTLASHFENVPQIFENSQITPQKLT